MARLVILLFIIIIVASCTQEVQTTTKGDFFVNEYAQNFRISKINNGYIVNVNDGNGNKREYLLSSSENLSQNGDNIIKIPVERVICFSSTHCAYIDVLNETETIMAISGAKYIYNNDLFQKVNVQKIKDVGFENRIDYEKIISINPDVIFAFAIDNNSIASLQKIEELNIPVVYVYEYTEPKILGRTEWLKVFACFYDKLEQAEHYCDSVFENYQLLSKIVKNKIDRKPNVLCSMPWKGVWWAPGGNSYFASLVRDAGGEYLLGENESNESIPYSIEEVFARSQNVDIWLNPNNFSSKEQIKTTDERLVNFPAFKTALIFNNNRRVNKYGGNDFWESGVVHPDIILKDLIKIFHPSVINDHELFFYKHIN